ncbi:hypothetical protein ACHAPT_002212 [Fusarium lateritium]
MTSRRACCSVTAAAPLATTNQELPDVAADLCAQCESIDLEALLNGDKIGDVWLKIRNPSPCPLCQFFFTLWASNKSLRPHPHHEVELGLGAYAPGGPFWYLHDNAVMSDALYSNQVLCLGTAEDAPSKNDGKSYELTFAISPIPHAPIDYRKGGFSILRQEPNRINFEAIKDWLTYCTAHHAATCKILPGYQHQPSCLKVIECETGAIIKAPEDCEFAALSYVWGSPQVNKVGTTSKTGFLLQDLPRTISDAIQVTMQLNLKYLWVDQYCINQKDEDELEEQISIMDMVYNFATVTLIAACGQDATFGLPGVGSTPRNKQPAININGTTWVSSEATLYERIKKSRWWSRAWTYQEGLFARRRLYFTEAEIFFECNNLCTQENITYDPHHLDDKAEIKLSGLYRGAFSFDYSGGLEEHIGNITQRQLTYQSDALNAMRGIFRAFASMPLPIRHFWGIPMDRNDTTNSGWAPTWAATKSFKRTRADPESTFIRGLCWRPERPSSRREGFPSWSWVGWTGPLGPSGSWATGGSKAWPEMPAKVIWLQRTDGTYKRISESVIAEIDAGNASGDIPYTPILRIETRVFPVSFQYLPNHGIRRHPYLQDTDYPDPKYYTVLSITGRESKRRGTCYWPLILSVHVEPDDELHRELCEETFDCILIGQQTMLVVRKVGDITERLGYIHTLPSAFRVYGPFKSRPFVDHHSGVDFLFEHIACVQETVMLG